MPRGVHGERTCWQRLPIAVMLAGLVASAVSLGAQNSPIVRALTDPPSEAITVEGIGILPVLRNVYMLVGAGANVTAQVGEQGIALVDSGAPGRTAALVAALKRLTRRPVRFLINSGPDGEYVGGNAGIIQAAGGLLGQGGGPETPLAARSQNIGIVTIVHENTSNRLGSGSRDVPAFTGDALPTSTFFTPRKDLYLNGEGIEILHQPAAHTDGDVFVYFRGSDVIAAGDIYSTDDYPRIDLDRGGSVQGEINALNVLVDIAIPERNQMGGTRIIPGHGHLANEADVVEYRDMVTIVRDRVRDLVKKGMTLAQVKAAKPTLEYDGLYGTRRDRTGEIFVETMYRDLSQPKSSGGNK